MQQSKLFPLDNSNKRKRNKFIVLSHIGNFSLKTNPLVPELEGYLSFYTNRRLENYYFETLERRNTPYHFLANSIQKDWEVFTSCPLNCKSDLMKKASETGYIDSFFEDAIIIAIQDDYALRIPEDRTYDVLSYKVIAPLLNTLKLGNARDCVFWFDEIFNIEKYNRDMELDQLNNPYPYKVKPMKYFDKVMFNLSLRRFI